MGYVIKNNVGVYICLDENGQPMTCSKVYKQVFTEQKARHVLKHIPKKLRKFNFQVVNIDEQSEEKENNTDEPKQEPQEAPKILEKDLSSESAKSQKKVITSSDYAPGENITRWIEKFGDCEDTLNEAKKQAW